MFSNIYQWQWVFPGRGQSSLLCVCLRSLCLVNLVLNKEQFVFLTYYKHIEWQHPFVLVLNTFHSKRVISYMYIRWHQARLFLNVKWHQTGIDIHHPVFLNVTRLSVWVRVCYWVYQKVSTYHRWFSHIIQHFQKAQLGFLTALCVCTYV